MVKWQRPRSIAWPGRMGLVVKIGYWLFCFQRGQPLFTRNVWGDIAMVRVIVNFPRCKRIFYAGFGLLPNRPR